MTSSRNHSHSSCLTFASMVIHCTFCKILIKQHLVQDLNNTRSQYIQAMSIHDPNTVDFFYFTGDQKSTPSCPVILRPNFNPSSAAQSYDNSDVNCTYPCEYNIPFFLEDLGPKSSEYSVNAHEARPGHHTQVCIAPAFIINVCQNILLVVLLNLT